MFKLWIKYQLAKFQDWNSLKLKIGKNGLRNSLLTAVMPTSCTAQILGNNESIEPFTSNVYSRRVLSGDFQILNPHLVNDLVDLQLWNENMKNQLIFNEGSIQKIPEIPQSIKDIYKTVWEISQRDIIDMAADRGAFIDQSQSMNLHLAEPSYGKCTSMHFYAWEAVSHSIYLKFLSPQLIKQCYKIKKANFQFKSLINLV